MKAEFTVKSLNDSYNLWGWTEVHIVAAVNQGKKKKGSHVELSVFLSNFHKVMLI